ncbi:hypothetical protein ACFFS2_11965 [Streptomyces aurantiacus]|nr:hypothetical protein [Streptomyces aurantiacus]
MSRGEGSGHGTPPFSVDYLLNFDAAWQVRRAHTILAICWNPNMTEFNVSLSPVVSSYRAGNDGGHDAGTAKDRKVRDSATILVRCWMSTVHRTASRPGSPTTPFRQDITS